MATVADRILDIWASLSTTQQNILYSIPLILSIWFYTAFMASTSFPSLSDCNILLLIAHPDDEAMFFSPALLALTQPSRNNIVKILCLSNGNADGIGKIRERELEASADILGIRKERVVVLDDPALQDDPKATWSPPYIAHVLSRFLLPEGHALPVPAGTASGVAVAGAPRTSAAGKQKQQAKDAPPPISTDVILTFDDVGVSSHPNHIACHLGAAAFTTHLSTAFPGWRIPLAVYNLTSISMARKYSWILDVPVSVFFSLVAVFWTGVAGQTSRVRSRNERTRPSWLMQVCGWGGYRKAQRAMYVAHKSQMRWFRWGWIAIGRYMVVNDLRRVF